MECNKGNFYEIIDLIPLAARAIVRNGENNFLLDLLEHQGQYRKNMPEEQRRKYEIFFRRQGDYKEWECEKAAALLWAADTQGPGKKRAREALFFLLSESWHSLCDCINHQSQFNFQNFWEKYADDDYFIVDDRDSVYWGKVPACVAVCRPDVHKREDEAGYYWADQIQEFPLRSPDAGGQSVQMKDIERADPQKLEKEEQIWIDLYVLYICLNVWMERPIRNGDAMTLALWEECRNIQRFVKEETETDFSDIQKERAAQLWETASEEWESVPRTVEDYLQMKPAESHLFLPAEEEGHDDNTEALRRWKIDVRQVRDKMTRMIPPDGEGVTADRETALMFFETALLYCASREVSEKIRRRFRYRVAWKELNRYPQNLMNWIMDREDRGENDMFTIRPGQEPGCPAKEIQALCIPLDFREKGLTKEHLIAKEYRSEKFSEYRYYIDFDESAGYIPL